MRLAVLIILTSIMTGCSWLVHDRTNDYLKSEVQPNIKVPQEVASVKLTPMLSIPDIAKKQALPDEFEVPRLAKLIVEQDVEDDIALASLNSEALLVELVKDGNGSPILRLSVGFARAWSELGEAIKRLDIKITDLNRSVGTYYIEVLDRSTVVTPGFWASLFGSEPEAIKKPLELKVNRARSGVYVAVHIDQDNLADDLEARALLLKLQKKLEDSDAEQDQD